MRTVVAALTLLAATSAFAEWVKVADIADTAYYVDSASRSDKANPRRIAVVQDYAKQTPGGVRSRRVVYDVDCANERIRSLSATEYSEPMASARSVSSWERESDWLYVAPTTGTNIASRTPYRAIVRFVCST